MKKYNHTNFFKHTFCEFQQIDDFNFEDKNFFKSKSESKYFYTDEGVFRKSNHWGKVANCKWKLIASKKYKSQQTIVGFAKWTDFYPLNSDEKSFYIAVDFENKSASIHPNHNLPKKALHNYAEAKEKLKKINGLLKNDQWTKYYAEDAATLTKKTIDDVINTSKSIQEIKLQFT